MTRVASLAYGAVTYAIFLAIFLYTVGFLTNTGVPKSIDSGTAGPALQAVLVNLGLLTIFALQHSVMARQGFKAWWTRIVPRQLERSTYVLASCAAFASMYALWQPLPATLWSVEEPILRGLLWGLFALGLATVLYSTFLIDHFDLFGLRQVVLYFRRSEYTEKRFSTPSLYRHIRHPLYVGWFITFWATPDMSVGHLLLASVASAYILVAIVFEERDLGQLLGDEYRSWRARTPMFIPRPRRSAQHVALSASQTLATPSR